MGCLEFRNAISARLDGEEAAGEAAMIDSHMATCADCADYADRAARVTRLTRTRPVEPAPDLIAAVLAVAPAPPRRWLRPQALRVALGAVGLGQCALAVNGIAGAAGHHDDAGLAGATIAHLAHESAAWNLALAIGFLWAATGVDRASGLVPLISGFVGVLTVLSVIDVLRGGVDPERLLSHGLVVAGLVLLLLLRRAVRRDGGDAALILRRDGEAGPFGASGTGLPGSGPPDGLSPTARSDVA